MLTALPEYEAFARQRTFYRLFTSVFCSLSLIIMISNNSSAQSGPPQEWFKKYGGVGEEVISSWVETDDGYLIGGSSSSGAGPHKTDPSRGGLDYWIIKLDKNGNKVWDKTFGGSSDDILKAIIKTPNNGFLLAGSSKSEIGGEKTAPNKGDMDFWVIEISVNGTKLWDKAYGGGNKDLLVSAIATKDGGFMLAGNSNSSISEDKSENKRPHEQVYSEGFDYWLIKINNQGVKVFDKTYGGNIYESTYNGYVSISGGSELLVSVLETTDGGYLLCGNSDSYIGFEKSVCDFVCNGSSVDYWIIKVNTEGIKLWENVYGGYWNDYLEKAVKGSNGQYLLLGSSNSTHPGNNPNPWLNPTYMLGYFIDEQGNINNWIDREMNVYETGNQFSYLSALSFESAYYTISQEYMDRNIVIKKYDWASPNDLIWEKTLPSLTTIEDTTENFYSNYLYSGFLEISKSGELFMGGSGYTLNAKDYWIYKFKSEGPAKFFYGGVDLNSVDASTKVGDIYYQGDKFFPNFSYTGRLFENQSIPLEPAPDAEKVKMIRSVVASRSTVPAVFNFNNIPPGTYEIYLYTWEDNFSTTFSIDIQNQRVLYNYNSGSKGSWAKLGPFKTTVMADGTIKIVASGGDANISGIELWRVEDGVLERAINLNSSTSIKVGDEVFEASKSAANFTYNGKIFENQNVALTPKVNDNTAKMICSSIYATRFAPATLNIGTETSGEYAVYLYIWEDNYSQNFKLDIDGQVVYHGNSGNKGQWQLLGPFNVVSGDNKIVITASGGDAMLSGVKLYRLNSSAPSGLAQVITGESATSFNVYPIPLGSKVNVVLPEVYKGKGSIAIMDPMGQTYLQQEKEYNGEKEFSIDLPALKSGVYYLKVQYGSKSEIKRLIKE